MSLRYSKNSVGQPYFSYGTALYLWGLSDRTPHLYDITVPRGQNITILKRDNPNLRSHYLPRDLYEIGITQTHSPQGAEVSYMIENGCICDLIRDKEQNGYATIYTGN